MSEPIKEQHNGTLDKNGEVHVYIDTEMGLEGEAVHLDVWHDRVSLMAGEALSLLDWLQSNRETLEQLKVKEAHV